jgi:hypothetical protein
MNCINIIIILVILLLVLSLKKSEMFAFVSTEGLDNPLVVFQKPMYPVDVPTPMGSYFPSAKLSYVGSGEPECDNGYGYYNLRDTKKVNGVNAKVIYNFNEYDAMCSPYVLNKELMTCAVYNKNNNLEFYGFMPKKC